MKPHHLLSLILIFYLSKGTSQTLTPWLKGYMDIHHINTGSGNSTFFIFPDGTTLLMDAGEVNRKTKPATNPLKYAPQLPNDSVSAAQCIVNYIRQVLPDIKQIDYAVITHFHPDHFGSIDKTSKVSRSGNYKLSGITEVNEYLPIRKLIDRNYPTYDYPVDIKATYFEKESFANYLTFIKELNKSGGIIESVKTGSNTQLGTITPYPDFEVRTICANGTVWSGKGISAQQIMPASIKANEYNENTLSIGVKMRYGRFCYFAAGDLTGVNDYGQPSWWDMETPVAKVTGKVDALSLNHHGVRDATNEFFLKTLAPQVIIQQSWSSNHPGEEVLHRIISKQIYPQKRDIFATYIHNETITTYGRWLPDNYQSLHGHVALRVSPGGNEFFVYVLDDSNTRLTISKTSGPYLSSQDK